MNEILSARMTCGDHHMRVRWRESELLSVTLMDPVAGDTDETPPPAGIQLLALAAMQTWLDWQDPVQDTLTFTMLAIRQEWLARLCLVDERLGDARNVIPLRREDHSMK